jgi:Mn-dependent DtxR family transcriptional regulator
MSEEKIDPRETIEAGTEEVAGIAAEVAHDEMAAWEHALETWFQDLRAQLGALDANVHNHLFTAKEELKARLRGLIA